MGTLMILGFLGSLGTTELLMVFVVVLILFGPKQLPEIARTIGKGLRDIRRAANQLKHEVGLDELDDIYPRARPTKPPLREVAPEDAEGVEGVEGVEEEAPGPAPVAELDAADDDPQVTAFKREVPVDPGREAVSAPPELEAPEDIP